MRNPKFGNLLSEMGQLHDTKNADYASDGNPYSNFEEAAAVASGFSGVDAVFASLIGVKLARLRELTRAGKTPNHEGIQDTRTDLAMYAALWASYTRSSEIPEPRMRPDQTVPESRSDGPDREDSPVFIHNEQPIIPNGNATDALYVVDPPLSYDERRERAWSQPCQCGALFTQPQMCTQNGRCMAQDHPHYATSKPVVIAVATVADEDDGA